MAALPTKDLSVKLIYDTLGVENGRELFYNSSTLKTLEQLGQIVNKNGLSEFCPGASADEKLSNLLTHRKLSYFKGYDPPSTQLGYLYSGYTILQSNFAPSGWHVPTKAEVETLVANLGGVNQAGGKLKGPGETWWETPNVGASNSSGMEMYGTGLRQYSGIFDYFLTEGYISTTTSTDGLNYFNLVAGNADIIVMIRAGYYRNMGMPVRLIKDDSTNPGAMTDLDGNEYPTVKIGNQVWIAANWKCSKMGNGTAIPTLADNTQWRTQAYQSLAKCAPQNNEDYV